MGEMIVMFEVHFSGLIKGDCTHTFPCLGQLAWCMEMDRITAGCRVPNLRRFVSSCCTPGLPQAMDAELKKGCTLDEAAAAVPVADVWFDPDDAWKTIDSVYQLSNTRSPEHLVSGIENICDELAEECFELRGLLEAAGRMGLQFKLDLAPAVDPPYRLVEWVHRKNEEMVEWIREIMESAGIEIKEEDHDE